MGLIHTLKKFSNIINPFYIKSFIPVDPAPTKTTASTLRTYEMTLELKFQSLSLPISATYGELYVLYSSRWKESGCICLGMAGHSNHTFLSDQKIMDDEKEDTFRVWVCVSDKQYQDTGWLADFELVSVFCFDNGRCSKRFYL